MISVPQRLIVALGELAAGVAEVPGPGTNPRIAEYLATVGMASDDDIPWCSAFVNWCVREANETGTGKANARSWLDWGHPIAKPSIGCVAVFKRGTGWQGHVGFVLDARRGGILLLGGNQGNRVSVDAYNTEMLLGYRAV